MPKEQLSHSYLTLTDQYPKWPVLLTMMKPTMIKQNKMG